MGRHPSLIKAMILGNCLTPRGSSILNSIFVTRERHSIIQNVLTGVWFGASFCQSSKGKGEGAKKPAPNFPIRRPDGAKLCYDTNEVLTCCTPDARCRVYGSSTLALFAHFYPTAPSHAGCLLLTNN